MKASRYKVGDVVADKSNPAISAEVMRTYVADDIRYYTLKVTVPCSVTRAVTLSEDGMMLRWTAAKLQSSRPRPEIAQHSVLSQPSFVQRVCRASKAKILKAFGP